MAHNRLVTAIGAALMLAAALPAEAQQIANKGGAGAAIRKSTRAPSGKMYFRTYVTYGQGSVSGGGNSKQQFNPDGRFRGSRGVMAPDTTIPVADYDPNVPTTGMSPGLVQLQPNVLNPLKPISPDVLTSGDQGAIGDAVRENLEIGSRRVEPEDVMCGSGRCCRPAGSADIISSTPFGSDIDPFVAHGNENTADAAESAAAPEPVLSVPETAADRLRAGKSDHAIVVLRSYTEANPDDAPAARTLALALIHARRTAEGIELMGRVYQHSPTLAATPIAADAVGQPRELRELLTRVVAAAHKSNAPSAWLTAAVLMQAEDRRDPALRMMDKADAAALSADVSSAVRAALKQR